MSRLRTNLTTTSQILFILYYIGSAKMDTLIRQAVSVKVRKIEDLVKSYLADIRENDTRNPLAFWKERRASYSKIAPIAEDLLSAPASQAFVERIFSVCGIFTDGRRNRMKNLRK